MLFQCRSPLRRRTFSIDLLLGIKYSPFQCLRAAFVCAHHHSPTSINNEGVDKTRHRLSLGDGQTNFRNNIENFSLRDPIIRCCIDGYLYIRCYVATHLYCVCCLEDVGIASEAARSLCVDWYTRNTSAAKVSGSFCFSPLLWCLMCSY